MAIGSEARSTFLAIVKGDASQAVTEFKRLGNTVEKSTKSANDSVGKFKKVTSGAFAEVKANAGMMAAGAGAAIGAFAIASVDRFAKLGVQIGKFSDATGLAVEDASRWVEVAGDIGIEANTVQTALNKLNRSIDPDKFKELGIAIAYTKDGATDVNGTFLNVIDRLNGIKDPAERATVATQLLGRNWQGMAELIGKGSTELKASLAEVSDAKVFNAAEVQRAKDVRAAMDKLQDTLDDLILTVGSELAPAFSDLVDKLGDIAGPAATAFKWFNKLNSLSPTNFVAWGNRLYDLATGAEDTSETLYLLSASFEDVTAFIERHNLEGEFAVQVWKDWNALQPTAQAMAKRTADEIGTLNDANKVNAQRMWEAAEAQREVEQTARDLQTAYDDLIGRVDDQRAWRDLSVAMWEANDGVGDTAAEVWDLKEKMADMIMEMDNIPAEKKTKLLTMVDRGALNEVYGILAKLQNTSIVIPVKPVGAGGSLLGGGGKRASGGPVTGGMPYLVGERGPELVVPRGNGNVITAERTRQLMAGATLGQGSGGNTYNTTVVVRQLPNERELIDLVNGVRRRQGGVI